ncbi:MAG: class I tRNA ligase family protein, partial [Clostridia bacterium]|nr:class I tRNA ligase family protein [Clostridia bacterium]
SLPKDLLLEDKWILSRLNKTVKEVNENLERFEIGIAATKLYDFAWDDFCDWYIELVKPRLFETNTNEATKKSAQQVLLYVLTDILKALHPFMPFITEEIYQNIPHNKESIMIDDYPVFRNELLFDAEEAEMNKVMELIKAVRNRRSEMNIAPSKKAHLYIETENAELFEKGKGYYERLASASGVTVGNGFDIQNAVTIVTDGAKTYIPLAELVDVSAELDRMAKEKEKLLSEIKRVDGMLSNEGFVSKAPAAKIEAEKAKKEKFVAMLEALEKSIEELKNM